MIKLKKILNEFAIVHEGASRPPGFSKLDVEPIEIPDNNEFDENLTEDNLPSDVMYKIIANPDVYWTHQKKTSVWDKSSDTPYIHNKNKVGDVDDLIKSITTHPKALLDRNSKIKKSGGKEYEFHNISLPAYRGIFYDESDKKLKILNTCPSAGICRKFCYAQKGGYVQFNRTQLLLTRKLNFLFNNWDKFKSMLLNEINKIDNRNKKRGIKTVIRWHDSGDFLSEKYLNAAFDIAKASPDVLHYTYTKMVGMASNTDVPKNFVFNFSFGGKEDEKINVLKSKHANIIGRDLYKPHIIKYKDDKDVTQYKFKNSSHKRKFKEEMGKKFGIDINSIITYPELLKMPYDKNNKKKWNVIVGPGDGDDAAMRTDVLGTYLMEH